MNKNSGFTLLEVLVSLAIFALVSLAIGQFTLVQLMSWSTLEEKAVGEIAAVNAMERARSHALNTSNYRIESREEIAGVPMRVITQVKETEIRHYLTISVEVFRARSGSKSRKLLYQIQGARYANP